MGNTRVYFFSLLCTPVRSCIYFHSFYPPPAPLFNHVRNLCTPTGDTELHKGGMEKRGTRTLLLSLLSPPHPPPKKVIKKWTTQKREYRHRVRKSKKETLTVATAGATFTRCQGSWMGRIVRSIRSTTHHIFFWSSTPVKFVSLSLSFFNRLLL